MSDGIMGLTLTNGVRQDPCDDPRNEKVAARSLTREVIE